MFLELELDKVCDAGTFSYVVNTAFDEVNILYGWSAMFDKVLVAWTVCYLVNIYPLSE